MIEGLFLLTELALMGLLLWAVVQAGGSPEEGDLGLFGFRRRTDPQQTHTRAGAAGTKAKPGA